MQTPNPRMGSAALHAPMGGTGEAKLARDARTLTNPRSVGGGLPPLSRQAVGATTTKGCYQETCEMLTAGVRPRLAWERGRKLRQDLAATFRDITWFT
jgi:hypothetical protein